MNEPPLFTIITVCYNAANSIEKTILSVLSQNYPNIEYIIIDGNSTDNTIDIIKKYQFRISKWISSPDKGIYDAMNKGIDLTTGDYINFMNAGDTFYNENVLSCIANKNLSEEVIYGDAIMITESYSFYQLPLPLTQFVKTLPFCHQSSFTKTSLIKKFKFDISYRSAADFNLMYQIWLNKYRFKYIPIPMSIFDARNGFSSKHKKRVFEEIGRITGKDKFWIGRMQIKINYLTYSMRNLIKRLIPLIISKKILSLNLHNYKDYTLK